MPLILLPWPCVTVALLLRNAITCRSLVSLELRQKGIVESLELWARKSARDLRQRVRNNAQSTEQIRLGLCGELVCEASKVITIGEVLRVHKTATKILHIHSSKSVCAIGVAANIEELWVESRSISDICEEVCVVIWVFDGTLIPIHRDSLLAWVPLVRS